LIPFDWLPIQSIESFHTESTMQTTIIDGLEVNYLTHGFGPPLLMLAPGGFDATMEKWTTSGVWKGMRPLDTLSSQFTVVAYDRRESGASGGRVEKLSWSLFAEQAKALMDHLGIPEAFILGGCMGCSVALAFAARFPEATHALILHWPVGGYRWKQNGRSRFARHGQFARENGLEGVVKRAHEGKSFWQDPEAGPWASCADHRR
jgi:pimeloyl-ACP methyl ester carboxylesterase